MSAILSFHSDNAGNKLVGIGNVSEFHEVCITTPYGVSSINQPLPDWLLGTYNIDILNQHGVDACDLGKFSVNVGGNQDVNFGTDQSPSYPETFVTTGWMEIGKLYDSDGIESGGADWAEVLPTDSTYAILDQLGYLYENHLPEHPEGIESRVIFLLGQGNGLFRVADEDSPTGYSWSGNISEFEKGAGYWLNSNRSGRIHLKNNVFSGGGGGINININPTAVRSVDGYENNLFSYIPTNQSSLPLNYSSGVPHLQEYLYVDCESNTQKLIPEGTILYANISYSDLQPNESGEHFLNTSAYYDGSTWSTTSTFNSLLVNNAYNIQFPADFTGCFRFDDPISAVIDDDVIGGDGVG